MRGDGDDQLWALTPLTPDSFVPQDHPIRAIRSIVDRALASLSPTFKTMYAANGRPSIPPEHLLKAMLLMAFYSIRSERQLCERLRYDLLFKFFVGLNIAEEVFDHSTFSKNRQRLLEHDVSRKFFLAVREEAQQRQLLSQEHFTVDGTLLDAWASMKSVQPREEEGLGPPTGGGRNPSRDFKGQRRRNETHVSRTDPDARLAKKGRGQAAKLAYAGHVLMENRNGLVYDVLLTRATGRAEREAALLMLDRQKRRRRITLGADKGYDSREFIRELRQRQVTPHVAQNQTGRRSAVDGRVTGQWGYSWSQRLRKRVEEIFGWVKTVAGGRKLRFIGLARNQLWAEMTASAYNLIRVARLDALEALA
jgi:transposase